MSDKILYVDDDQNILAACKRSLSRKLNITTASRGVEGLDIIQRDGPFAVVLSDMRMPEMDGIEFICQARKLFPDTICIMLTGNADQETAMNAVNRGHIFRFLTKPCSQDILLDALQSGIKQYRLIKSEKELLQKTLTGSIRALADILALVNPKAFAVSSRIKPIVKVLVRELNLENPWQYEIAAMLSQIGCIVLPTEMIDKIFSGENLTDDEAKTYASHPENGRKLLEHIPRLERCAKMIEYQLDRYHPIAKPDDPNYEADTIVLGAQIIHASLDMESYLVAGLSRQVAVSKMREKAGEYNPDILHILQNTSIPGVAETLTGTVKELLVSDLVPGMYANDDIYTRSGMLLVPKGSEVTHPLITRLKNFAKGVGIEEPIQVLIPMSQADNTAA